MKNHTGGDAAEGTMNSTRPWDGYCDVMQRRDDRTLEGTTKKGAQSGASSI